MLKKTIWTLITLFFLYAISIYIYNQFNSQSIVLSPLAPSQISTCNQFHDQDTLKSTVRILVVDGGGIDGVMPLVVLRYLEEKTHQPISALFDFFTGTSTGSIITTVLNVPNDKGQPKYSANQLLEMYKNLSKNILTPSMTRIIFTLHGLFGPRLSVSNLHDEFTSLLGKKLNFGSLLKQVAITTYNLDEEKLTIFNSWECKNPGSRFPAADIITAAAATPMFFSPVIFTDDTENKQGSFVDGMIFANNPSLAAIREAFKLYPNAKNFIIVHLGTGGTSVDYLKLSGIKVERWGTLRWIGPMITILYKAQNTVIKEAIAGIQDFNPNKTFHYYLFDKKLYVTAPFDASKENIASIEHAANELLINQKETLDSVAQELLAQVHK